jgi:hypothetical protein
MENLISLKTSNVTKNSREISNPKNKNVYDKFTIDNETEQLLDEARFKDKSRSVPVTEHKESDFARAREASTISTNERRKTK